MTWTRDDFTSDQEVRWCPGCGDYAVLATLQRLMPELNVDPDQVVFVSGIGCASRFPYYMKTYGFHTIHGRAPAIATGLKITNPDLSVWVVVGDGDGLSIGAHHLMHLMRRNVNVNVIMLNNQIYGLTKGQYSPTSVFGQVTKTSPHGTLEKPLNPLEVALAADCSFVARAIDVDAKNLSVVLKAAWQHRGTSFVEILQNCNVFNDGAFEHFADRKHRDERCIYLQDQKPLLFGSNSEKALAWEGSTLQVVDWKRASDVVQRTDSDPNVLTHEIHTSNRNLAYALASMQPPDFPVALGILRKHERPCYEDLLRETKDNQKNRSLSDVFRKGHVWEVLEE